VKSLASNLKKVCFQIVGEKHKDLLTLNLAWADIVGEIMTQKTRIERFEKNVLFIKAVNHLWRQEIVSQKPIYLEKIKTKTNIDVKDIKVYT